MATPKKKHLIELMIEEGVEWPEGAEYAAQDKLDCNLYFFKTKPFITPGDDYYAADGGAAGYQHQLPSLCRNWHQTVVTREQYAEAVAAGSVSDQAADAVEWHNPPSIEQLTADYHAKAAEADRLQAVADEALKAADDALLALEKAGEAIGLVISVDTKSKLVEPPVEPEQQVITDWRDLRVGDVIECVGNWEGENTDGNTYHVTGLDPIGSNSSMPIQIRVPCVECQETWGGEFKFIRRP